MVERFHYVEEVPGSIPGGPNYLLQMASRQTYGFRVSAAHRPTPYAVGCSGLLTRPTEF